MLKVFVGSAKGLLSKNVLKRLRNELLSHHHLFMIQKSSKTLWNKNIGLDSFVLFYGQTKMLRIEVRKIIFEDRNIFEQLSGLFPGD